MNKKDAYIAKAQAKIDEQVAKLNVLKAKAKGEIAEQKIKSQEKIKELEAKINQAKAHVSEIADAAEDAWENLKNRFDTLAEDIGGSFRKFFGKEEQDSHPEGKQSEDK